MFCQFEHHEQESKTTVYNNNYILVYQISRLWSDRAHNEVQRKILMIYDQNVAIITNKGDNKNVVLIF